MPTSQRKIVRAALFACRFIEQQKIDSKFPNRVSDAAEFSRHRDEMNALSKWYADSLTGISNMPLPIRRSESLRRSVEEQDTESLSSIEAFFLGILGGMIPGLDVLPIEQQLMFTAVQRMMEFCMYQNFSSLRTEAESLAKNMGYVPSAPHLREKPGTYITNVILKAQPKVKDSFWRFKNKPKM